jgi:hypothetical protein
MTKKPNNISKKAILFMNADPEESTGISFLLKEADFSAHSVGSPSELKKRLKEALFMAVIIDLDSVAVDNRTIETLPRSFQPSLSCAFQRNGFIQN